MTTARPEDTTAEIVLCGVPMDAGGSGRGAAGGPAAMRGAGIATIPGRTVIDGGDVEVPTDPDPWVVVRSTCEALRRATRDAVLAGRIPLALGGDHALAAGAMSGVAAACRALGSPSPGLLWIDAHADLNTLDTSPTGNPHGMPAASLLGHENPAFASVIGADGTFPRDRACFIGCRELDPGERARLEAPGDPTLIDGDALVARDLDDIAREAIAIASPDGGPFAISFDIDLIDPEEAPGITLPAPGGPSSDRVFALLERLGRHPNLVAVDVVEVDPTRDRHGATSRFAVEAVRRLLGRHD